MAGEEAASDAVVSMDSSEVGCARDTEEPSEVNPKPEELPTSADSGSAVIVASKVVASSVKGRSEKAS